MAKYIKSVRIRRKFANGFDTKTELDIRVAIYDRAFSKRSVLGVEPNKQEDPDKLNKIWPEVEYSGSRYKDLTDDEVLTDYIRTQSKLNYIEYSIIQDPWTPEPPIFRNYGFDPYYLNNGTELYVKWFKFDDPMWYEVPGTFESGKTGSVPNVIDIKRSEPISGGTVSANSGDRYLVGRNPTGPNWSKYGNTMPIVQWNAFGQFWTETFLEDGMTVYVDLEEVQYKYSSGSPVIVAGGTEWSDKKGNEMEMTSSDYLIKLQGGTPSNPKSQIIKKVETIKLPSNSIPSGEMLMLSVDNKIVKYGGSASREIPSGIPDIDIVNSFIDQWKRVVPNYDLKLCDPANQKCELIEYISPIEPLPGPSVEPTGGSPSGASPSGLTTSKQKLTIVFPEDFKVMAREDVPKFSIWIGEPQSEEAVDEFQYGPEGGFELDDEYKETPFEGAEETFTEMELQGPDGPLSAEQIKNVKPLNEELDTSGDPPVKRESSNETVVTKGTTKALTSFPANGSQKGKGETNKANNTYAEPYGITVKTVEQAQSSAYKALLRPLKLPIDMYYVGSPIGNKQKLINVATGNLEEVKMSDLKWSGKGLNWTNSSGTQYKYGKGSTFPYKASSGEGSVMKSLLVHKLAAPGIENAYQMILEEYGLEQIWDLGLNTTSGTYVPRAKRGGSEPSIHSWAVAIDICAGPNGLKTKCPTALFCKPEYKKFLDIMEANGWWALGRSWGQDYMHFQAIDPR